MSQAFSNKQNSFNIGNTFINITPDDESKILAWLSPLESGARHRDIGAQRLDSIGSWLLETQEFRRWHDGNREDGSNHHTLFCHGNPGAGKSYIISLVIDKLRDEAAEEATAVVCFYFDFAARNEQSPVNMLGSLLRQLVSGLDGIPEAVVQSFRNRKKAIGGKGLQVAGILKMFQTITATKRTFICVDALDECVPENRMVILESLEQIARESFDTRIFLTGRLQVRGEVERKFGGAAASVLIEPTGDGIIGYILEQLKSDTTPEMMSSTLEASIMETISHISSETFLMASLHLDAILRETSISRRRIRLVAVKGVGLGDAYGATLEWIKAQGGEKTGLAMATLMWICHAERPLQVDELRHALAVEIGATDFHSENAPSIGALLSCCQGLITVDKEASTVRVIHFTAQEYLCAQPDLFNHPHSVIAEVCLTYLNSPQVKNLPSRPVSGHQVMPFLKYSSRYWGTHANKELSSHAVALGLQLVSQYEGHPSAVSLCEQVLPTKYMAGTGSSPHFSGLHCASFFGIVELVASLTNALGGEINLGDCGGYTPLLWAAKNGHDGVAKLLLEHEDIDPNKPNNYGSAPLSWAADNGHEGVVKLLLDRNDVDPNRPDENNQTPLGYAAIRGRVGVVKLLLAREDIKPDRLDNQERTPLLWGANNGHEAVVKLLLGRNDIDPNRPDNQDGTPLSWAARYGHKDVVKLLLGRKDVDSNRLGQNSRTPLASAAAVGQEGVVKILLGWKDVDPNRLGHDGQTPLYSAAWTGHGGVVKILLGHNDINPGKPDVYGQTPLFGAASNGHERVVELLLGREDVNPNKPDNRGRTPLYCASRTGYEGVVKILLNHNDIDPDKPDVHGQTPLFGAASNGHERVVEVLLTRDDVDPDKPNKNGQTPLFGAAWDGHEGVTKILLGHDDVSPNKLDKSGRTPLWWAAKSGHASVVALLQPLASTTSRAP